MNLLALATALVMTTASGAVFWADAEPVTATHIVDLPTIVVHPDPADRIVDLPTIVVRPQADDTTA